MRVVVQGKVINLNPKDVLGTGGEAVVIKKGKAAYKIFHKPSREKTQKLQALLKKGPLLPDRVLAPRELVKAEGNGRVVGYMMPLADPGAEPLAKLSNRNFRKTSGINIKDVTDVFLNAYSTVEKLHRAGFVVGDLNDLNEIFLKDQVYFIDVDSFQFDRFPCQVATEPFLSPALYNKDLTSGLVFTPETDWYSFAVLLFRSLLLVHPYGGVHPKINQLTERAKKKVTAFDKDVRYPKFALSREILSDALLEYFEKTFEKGRIGQLPKNILEEYNGILIECPKCHEYFPHSRRQCPVCSTKSAFVINQKIILDYEISMISETSGHFIYSKLVGNKLYAIAYENGMAVLHTWRGGKTQKTVLFPVAPDLGFDIALDKVILLRKGSERLIVLDTDDGSVVTKTTTDLFQNYPVKSGTKDSLYRAAGGILLKSEMMAGNLVSRTVTTIADEQTWFHGETVGDKEKLVVVSRIFDKWVYRVLINGASYEADVRELEKGEKLVSLNARFDTKGTLVIRETKKKGKAFVLLDYISDKGVSLFKSREPYNDEDHGNLQGATLGNGSLLFATANGLKGKSLTKGSTFEFTGTDKFIQGDEKLHGFQGNIVVVSDNKVFLIRKR
ncbi:MAG: hypothetical protein Q7S53_05050 [bacterium]|nr:hypothetical protein [bacterium]